MTEDKNYFEKEVFSSSKHKFTFSYDTEILNQILKYKKNGKVLDLGCGEGGISLELAKKGFDVTCVDISSTAINKIKQEAQNKKINIIAVCEDLTSFKINSSYDIIICLGVLHFLKQDLAEKLVKMIQNKTNKEGVNFLDVLTGKGFFKEKQIKEMYYFWKIEDFETHKESFGKMDYLVAIKIKSI